VPYVLINRHYGARPVNCVTFDWEAAAEDAAQRLIQYGHRRLALLLPAEENTSVVGRADGWRAGARRGGLAERDAPILRYEGSSRVTDHSLNQSQALARRLLREGLPGTGQIPTALVGFNDWSALGILRAAAELRVRVPEQLSVIGFDSTRIGVGTTPPLCSYAPRFIDLGQQAAALLTSALRGELDGPRRVIIPVDFTCRGSCGLAPR
jgi:LacI family transcriptional regulator